ncbi:MAG: hypothetical protein JKY87_02400 [Mariprofundus sp.]|nr:hypothetical protein [Mariprofundus sp.]
MQPVKEQYYRLKLLIFICVGVGLTAMFAIYGLHQAIGNISISMLTKDSLGSVHAPIYIGILSNIGIMLWSSTVAVCLFAAVHIRFYSSKSAIGRFLLFSAMLTFFLAIDDAFMLHESIFPDYLHWPEIAIYMIYAVMLGGYFMCCWRYILETDYLLLFCALFFLGGSVVMDTLFPYSDIETFFEDVLKFCGIVFWLAYFSKTASAAIEAVSQHDGSLER